MGKNFVSDNKKLLRAEYKRYLIENHCIPKEKMDTMSTAELKHQYEYWSVVLSKA